MSDCLGKWVSAYVDGEIDGRRRDRLVSHLAGCERCRQLVAEERAAKQRLADTWLPTASSQLRDRLLEADSLTGASWQEPGPRLRRRTLLLAGLATAGTAAAVAVVVTAPRESPSGPAVTPPLAQFSAVHLGSTFRLPVGGPALGVQPAAFTTPAP